MRTHEPVSVHFVVRLFRLFYMHADTPIWRRVGKVRRSSMATPLCVTRIPCFSPSGDISSVSNRWGTWLERFDIFAHASGCTDDRQKRMLLLHTAGEGVQDICATLADKGAPYDEAAAALNAHFQPQVNVTFQRHVFRRECQKADETVSQFVIRLRKLAQHCEFRAQSDAFIRDQVVDKCISKILRTQLQAERDLTLDRLLTLARAK